jgi:hypothetical protein
MLRIIVIARYHPIADRERARATQRHHIRGRRASGRGTSALMPSPEEVIAHVFTSKNPATGSAPPAEIAWVVFEHGTVFFSVPTDELPAGSSLVAIADAARAALRELGPVRAGTPSADFNPTQLTSWYPDEPVWFVGFDHPSLVTIVTMEAEPLVAGIAARGRRQHDHDEQTIVVVRGFDGATDRPTLTPS